MCFHARHSLYALCVKLSFKTISSASLSLSLSLSLCPSLALCACDVVMLLLLLLLLLPIDSSAVARKFVQTCVYLSVESFGLRLIFLSISETSVHCKRLPQNEVDTCAVPQTHCCSVAWVVCGLLRWSKQQCSKALYAVVAF
jgi:hypothetical protein